MTELQIKSEQRKDKRSRRSSRRAAKAAADGEGEGVAGDAINAAAAAAAEGDFLAEMLLDTDCCGPALDLDAELSGGPAAEYEAAGAGAGASGGLRHSHGTHRDGAPVPAPSALQKKRNKFSLPAIPPTGKPPLDSVHTAGKSPMASPSRRPSRPGPSSPLATRHDETPPTGRSSRLMHRRDAGPLGGLSREASIGHAPHAAHAPSRIGRSKSAKSSVARSLSPDLFGLDFGYARESSVESSMCGHSDFDPGPFEQMARGARQELAGAHRTALPRVASQGKGKELAGSPLAHGAQKRWGPATMGTKLSLPSIGSHGLPKLIGPSDPCHLESKPRCIKRSGRFEKPTTEPEPKKDVCTHCARRLKITSTYHCRCGGMFCGRHRHSESHTCSFDYKTSGRQMLAAATTKVEPPKLPKI